MATIYFQNWHLGQAVDCMGYTHTVQNNYYERNAPNDPGPDGNLIDALYPECVQSEAVKVVIGGGPSGQNTLELDPAIAALAGNDWQTVTFVGTDFGPIGTDVGLIGTGRHWWNAFTGRITYKQKFVSAGQFFTPLLQLFEERSGGFASTGFDLSYFQGAEQFEFYTSYNNVTLDFPKTLASLLAGTAWHDIEFNWRCATTDNGLTTSKATRNFFGSGTGLLAVTAEVGGLLGNNYRVRRVLGVGANAPMTAAIVGYDVTITLGRDGAGNLDNTKNTYVLIAAAITALTDVDAAGSGTGFFDTADSFRNLLNGGIIAAAASDGFATVSLDGAVIFDLQNIPLVMNFRYNNLLRAYAFGFDGMAGPVTDLLIESGVVPPTTPDPVLISSKACCESEKGVISSGAIPKIVNNPFWTPSCTGGGMPPSASDLSLIERWDY